MTAKRTAKVRARPSVLYGSEYKGIWYIKPNENYSIQFLRDAGGEYVFKDIHGVASKKLDTEAVLKQGHDAEFWIDGPEKSSVPEILKSATSECHEVPPRRRGLAADQRPSAAGSTCRHHWGRPAQL